MIANVPGGRVWPAVIGGWLLAVAVLGAVGGEQVLLLRFPDPDDAMRLLQVRDWLGGQGWWDVAQHRLNGGHFPMHWSRVVDLPIATVLLALDPLVGPALADRAAGAIVPAVTLLVIMTLAAVLTQRLAGAQAAQAAVLVVALAMPVLVQVQPMRIDHHGWQIALALAAAVPLTHRPDAQGGLLCGFLLALLLSVSLEGMPFVVAATGIAALAWAVDPARRPFLLAHAWALVGASALLHAAARGPALWQPACDALSPGWLATLAAGALGVTAAALAPMGNRRGRLALLVPVGAAAAAVAVLVQPDCLRGPFGDLPPLVRRVWYENVLEGMPIWRQRPDVVAGTLGLPLVGLLGGWLAWRDAAPAARPGWLILWLLGAAATLTACLVIRAGGVASAVAAPGAAVLMLRVLGRARAVSGLLPRVAATAGALTVATPGVAVAALGGVDRPDAAERAVAIGRPACVEFDEMRVLGRLPKGVVFAPVDVSPDILVGTRHGAVAGGYHRNADAIGRVIAGFTAPPAQARAIVRASGATYLSACPGFNETELYKQVAPDGLWARLERGEQVPWLRPVPMPGSAVMAWQVE